jgi:3-oxoacyl-[acyl-carrier protein] reductase
LTSLEGTTVVVTGGSRGIGRATVELLLDSGANVAVLARDSEALRETARLGAVTYPADVTDEAAVVAAFAGIEQRFGDIHGLFANAGIGVLEGPVHLLPSPGWDRVIATNLRGTYVCLRETLTRMMARNHGGSIVCTSSCVAQTAIPGVGSAYHASKGAVEAMVRSVAVDYGRHGIRCNAISPGATDTQLMWTGVGQSDLDAVRQQVAASIVLGRVADPAEIARAAVWLLSDSASYVTGSTLVVDGGVTITSVLPT